MEITNGSVSRTYKPGDYEARTVTLSFTLEPTDDVDASTAKVAYLAEKHARHMPTPEEALTETAPVPPTTRRRATAAAPPATTVVSDGKDGHGPTATTAASPSEASAKTPDPFAAGALASSEPASAPGSASASNAPSKSSGSEPTSEITDAMMLSAITQKNGDVRNTQMIRELIVKFNNDDPLARYLNIAQDKRAEFLAALKDIKV